MANGDLDVAGAAGKGALAGASTGAAIGSAVPGIGTAIGAVGGAVVGGIASGVKANKAKKASEIPAQDPQELARLAEIDRIRKLIGAGTDPLTQQKLREAQQVGASTQANIARVTGGNVGATIAGLIRAQRGTQAASNQAIAGAQQRLPFFENLGQQLRTRVSQRALELGLQKRDQALAEKAAAGKANSANISGALGVLGNEMNALQTPQAAVSAGQGMMKAMPGAIPNQNQSPQLGVGDSTGKGTMNSVLDMSGVVPSQPNNQAPLSSGYQNFEYGQGFDPNSVIWPGGLPSPQAQANPAGFFTNAAGSVNALGTTAKNLDNLGNMPL